VSIAEGIAGAPHPAIHRNQAITRADWDHAQEKRVAAKGNPVQAEDLNKRKTLSGEKVTQKH